jgi:molybdenum cofactor cytidylyltransferase
MGKLKQLLPLADKSAIRHCLDAIMSAGIEDVTVVLGREHEAVRKEMNGFPVKIAVNGKAGSEMAESIRAGLAAAASATGLLVCLADHPLVSAATIRTLIEEHGRRPDLIVIPVYGGKRGHPCIFPSDEVRKVFAGMNLREIVAADPSSVEYVGVDDEGVVLDMDTEEDYRLMQKKFGEAYCQEDSKWDGSEHAEKVHKFGKDQL